MLIDFWKLPVCGGLTAEKRRDLNSALVGQIAWFLIVWSYSIKFGDARVEKVCNWPLSDTSDCIVVIVKRERFAYILSLLTL